MTDEDGDEVARYAYDPYGGLVGMSGDPIATRNPLRYRGYYYDNETQLYYLPARYYNPDTGRFLSVDPAPPSAGDPTSLNGYAYCVGDPVQFADPDGRKAIMDGDDGWHAPLKQGSKLADVGVQGKNDPGVSVYTWVDTGWKVEAQTSEGDADLGLLSLLPKDASLHVKSTGRWVHREGRGDSISVNFFYWDAQGTTNTLINTTVAVYLVGGGRVYADRTGGLGSFNGNGADGYSPFSPGNQYTLRTTVPIERIGMQVYMGNNNSNVADVAPDMTVYSVYPPDNWN